MKITFKNETSTFVTEHTEDLEGVFHAVQSGLIAMGYHPNTAKQFLKELIEDEDAE